MPCTRTTLAESAPSPDCGPKEQRFARREGVSDYANAFFDVTRDPKASRADFGDLDV